MRQGHISINELIADLERVSGITHKTGLVEMADDAVERFKLLAASGKETADGMVEAFLPKIAELRDQFLQAGKSMPQAFVELDMALQQGQGAPQVLDAFMQKFKKQLPDDVAIAKEALKHATTSFKDDLRDASEQLTGLGKQLTTLANSDWEIKVKAALDLVDLERQLHDAGLARTGGQLP